MIATVPLAYRVRATAEELGGCQENCFFQRIAHPFLPENNNVLVSKALQETLLGFKKILWSSGGGAIGGALSQVELHTSTVGLLPQDNSLVCLG
jgi:hypothetical protein